MATSPHEDNVQATASEAPGSADPLAEPEERLVETVARYEIFEEIARGGGGRILRGWDKVLDRDVVLKVPVRSTGTARLAREALITAQLQHPAVVPVYAAGKLSDGTPFYVMKLVAGRSFRDEIANTATLQARVSLLPVMIAVCDVMAYAHSKRVIHRDLKPSNVLIGAFGEVAVIDWGMAKRIDGTDTDYVLQESGMLVGSAEHTKTGAVLGTPAYMAPEQARGQDVDDRADVYALGAMLYQQFTGERPYAGLESHDIIRAVLDGTLPPVEAKVPQLPRELAAIVRKAMSPDAADRYPSAKELAEDLKRYQTGRLVEAHQYSAASLMTRWLRKNRIPVAVASLSIVALAAGGIISVGRIVAEKNNANEQRAAAEELVDFMLVDLRERLRFVGKVALLDGVTSKVDTYYQRLAAQGVVLDLGALRRKGQALSTLGRVREDQGNTTGAIEAQRAAAVVARRVAESPGAADERWQDLVDALTELANMEVNSGSFAQGRADYDEALDISRKRLERAPREARWIREKARILALIGYLEEHEGNVQRSLDLYREATSLQRPLAEANPEDVEIAKDLAYSHGKYASQLAAAGRLTEALDMATVAQSTSSRFVKANPGDLDWQWLVALNENDVADVLKAMDRGSEAVPHLEAALATRRRLAQLDPENRMWTFMLSDSHSRLADQLSRNGDGASAQQHISESIAILESIVAAEPDKIQYVQALDINFRRAGGIEKKANRLEQALEWYERARALEERLAAETATNGMFRDRAATTLVRTGEMRILLGRYPEATTDLDRALGLLDTRLQTGDAAARDTASEAQALLGIICTRTGKTGQAVEHFRAAEGLAEISSKAGSPRATTSYERLRVILRKLDEETKMTNELKEVLVSVEAARARLR